MGFDGASGWHTDQNSGGTIGGGGTLNRFVIFTPNGTTIGNGIIAQDPGSNSSVIEVIGSATVQTSDATTTTLQTITIPTDSVFLIESKVVSKKTAGVGIGTVGDGNGYIRTVKAKNVAGVVTIGVVQTSFT